MGLSSKTKFYSKCFVLGCLIFVCAIYGVIASIVLRITGKEQYAQYTFARSLYFLVSKCLNIKVIIKNEELLHIKPSVVISNHQSALDVVIVGRLFQPGYTVVAKKSLKYVPFFGSFLRASHTVFLDRSKGEKAKNVLEDSLTGLKHQKGSILIFPEGTRSATKKLESLPFKKGAFHLAKHGQIPVIPVAVSNYSKIFHSGDKVFNQGEVIIEVLKPMATDNLKSNEDVTEFATEARERILERIETMGYASDKLSTLESYEQEEMHSEDSIELIEETMPVNARGSGRKT